MCNYSILITLGSFAVEALPILLGKSPLIFSHTQRPFAHLSSNLSFFIAEAPVQAWRFQGYIYYIFCKMKEIKDRQKKVKSECTLVWLVFRIFG